MTERTLNQPTIFQMRAGSIVRTGIGCPRCFRVLDSAGQDATRPPDVDRGSAFRLLSHMAGHAGNVPESRPR